MDQEGKVTLRDAAFKRIYSDAPLVLSRTVFSRWNPV
jgi:hypothetical protein